MLDRSRDLRALAEIPSRTFAISSSVFCADAAGTDEKTTKCLVNVNPLARMEVLLHR